MKEQHYKDIAFSTIEKAADLLLKCSGYLDDIEASKRDADNEIEIYYAIDTDVITLYLEPEKNAEYTDVFGEGSASKSVKALTFLLADFLVASTEPLLPLKNNHKCRFLIIPPHDVELLGILNAIRSRFLREANKLNDTIDDGKFKELSTIFEKYEQSKDFKYLTDALSNCVPDLVDLYIPYRGAKAALMRFDQLPITTFQRIDTYFESENNFAFPLLDPINNIKDRMVFNELRNKWVVRLEKHKRKINPSETSIKDDAEVLATIQYVNDALSKINKKIVLITGSPYLFDAVDDNDQFENIDTSFSELYLRHPQAFLANPDFFSYFELQKSSFKLVSWLSLFFPKGLQPAIQTQGAEQRAFLRNIKKGKNKNIFTLIDFLVSPDRATQPIESLLDFWHKKVNAVAETKYLKGLELADERGASELAIKLIEIRKKNDQWSVTNLQEFISKESTKLISVLFNKTAWIGLWSKAPRVQFKGVPELRLDDKFREFADYLGKVIQLQLLDIGGIDLLTEYRNQFEEVIRLSTEVERKDPTLYHTHIIHALAFAVKGHWDSTLTLAKIAISISDDLWKNEGEFRRGREAAYLACIALRRSAKDLTGLQKAEKYLNLAYERENKDAKSDIRFSSERCAIDTRKIYFKIFCENENRKNELVDTTMIELYNIIENSKDEENERIRMWVQRQSITNLFSLLVIAYEKWSEAILTKDKIQNTLDLFHIVLQKIDKHKHKPEDDPYPHLIYHIANYIWGPDTESQKNSKEIALLHLSKPKFYMPYDAKRWEFLKQCFFKEITF
ncbi:MAG: hypothetical protein ABR936_16955 [Bacteroidota bacterium]